MSSKSLTFQLPLPDKRLKANKQTATRGGRIAKAKQAKVARERARAEVERVLADAGIAPPRWVKASYVATLCKLTNTWPDPDNFMASLKAYLDGIADAGIVLNDRGLWPERPVFKKVTRFPRVEITVTQES